MDFSSRTVHKPLIEYVMSNAAVLNPDDFSGDKVLVARGRIGLWLQTRTDSRVPNEGVCLNSYHREFLHVKPGQAVGLQSKPVRVCDAIQKVAFFVKKPLYGCKRPIREEAVRGAIHDQYPSGSLINSRLTLPLVINDRPFDIVAVDLKGAKEEALSSGFLHAATIINIRFSPGLSIDPPMISTIAGT